MESFLASPLPGQRVAGLLVLLSLFGAASTEPAGTEKPPSEDAIVQLLPRDAIPAIRKPRFIRAEEASLRSDEKVLGILIGGEARAYPLIDLDRHEIVDDVVAKTPIAATW
jgi:hypothetical protein